MKRLSILFFSLATLVSCHKDDTATSAPTSIEVTANDDNGKPVSGATVELFDLSTDPVNGSLVAKATTDTNGKYLFTKDSNGKELASLIYGYKVFTPQDGSI